jgi:hypothetical protein
LRKDSTTSYSCNAIAVATEIAGDYVGIYDGNPAVAIYQHYLYSSFYRPIVLLSLPINQAGTIDSPFVDYYVEQAISLRIMYLKRLRAGIASGSIPYLGDK